MYIIIIIPIIGVLVISYYKAVTVYRVIYHGDSLFSFSNILVQIPIFEIFKYIQGPYFI